MTPATSSAPANMHHWLRNQTHALHHELDHTPLLGNLMQSGLTAGAYIQCLHLLQQAHARTEPWLIQLDHARPAALAAYESRLPALNHDLQTLRNRYPGAASAMPSAMPARRESEPALPEHADPASLYVGIRYVLEGASQGARFITQRLQQNAPELLEHGCSYWQHQSRMMNHWQSLITLLGQTPQSIQPADLLNGARSAFGQFLAVFTCPAQHP